MADLAETNFVGAGLSRVERGIEVSAETREMLEALHAKVLAAVRLAVEAIAEEDSGKAARVVGMKSEVNALAAKTKHHQTRRLAAEAPRRVETYRFETELVESLKRVFYFAKRLGRELLAVAGGRGEAPNAS